MLIKNNNITLILLITLSLIILTRTQNPLLTIKYSRDWNYG